jgi:hypothetical protein
VSVKITHRPAPAFSGEMAVAGEALKVDGALTVVVDIAKAIEVIIKTAITSADSSFTYSPHFYCELNSLGAPI